MRTDWQETFMDRHDALALFDEPRSRDSEKPWPLLPILAFIAPGGSGKSMLINYLRATRCRATLPHAHIDFTVPSAPTDLLAILVRLRDELQQQADGAMKDVLHRLQVLSLPGTRERDMLVNELLPAAFMADLSAALVEAHPPEAWSPDANVLIFLDGFEALQSASSITAMQLLRGLAIEPREQGQTGPLLLVIGSRDPLPGMTEDKQPDAFPRTAEDEATAKQQAHDLYTRWQQRLPSKPQALRHLGLEELVLPLWLQDFGHEHTRSYLLKVGERQ